MIRFPSYLLVYPSYAITYVYLTILDANDNAPMFHYPQYPDIFTNTNDNRFYIGIVPLLSQSMDVPVTLVVSCYCLYLSDRYQLWSHIQ